MTAKEIQAAINRYDNMTLSETKTYLENIKLEELPLKWLINFQVHTMTLADHLTRSAREIRGCRLAGSPLMASASTTVRDSRDKLCSLIESEAMINRAFVMRLDEEICRRLDGTDK